MKIEAADVFGKKLLQGAKNHVNHSDRFKAVSSQTKFSPF